MTGCIDCHKKERVGTPEECQLCHISPHGVEQACSKCHSSTESWTDESFTHPVKLVGNHAKLKCDQCHTNKTEFKGLTFISVLTATHRSMKSGRITSATLAILLWVGRCLAPLTSSWLRPEMGQSEST